MAKVSLKKELDFFIKHQNELVKHYEGKFLVLKNQKVVGAYATMHEAYWKAQKEHTLGTFAIYHCIPGPEAYTQVFHSHRAVFR